VDTLSTRAESETMEDEKQIYKQYLEADFPLLEMFREVAPGSYKHSQNVENIVESIAIELKLNVDLMKVSALYHDVGKMINPKYFSENQEKDNPHDSLEPWVSYQIISRHVSDTIAILLNYDFPRKVMKIISQHHGDTVLRYFYDKSKAGSDELYRYKCTKKPECDEAAILMIVDSVEASARSLSSNGKLEDTKSRRSLVDSTVNRLIDDSQLDNMRIGTIKTIRKVLYKELEAIYHKRVSYEGDETIGETRINGLNGISEEV
jgi:putative nucleotidyltransferase with HDIG domain